MTLTKSLCASTAIVAIGAIAFTQPTAAEEATPGAFELPPVVSTASRLAAGLNSSSVTVIDKEKINRHPGKSLPAILAAEAGLNVRDFFGNGNETATVDIRGFGEQAGQNVLVLVDGRRSNDLDLGGVQFGLVPRANIQRIEVLRGSAAAVLYGEGGVGGAINIITQGGEKTQGVSATGTLGSFGYKR
ncbi:MAG: TonB-dependent receptor, partial [Candidatus Phaeomarinobacter sp.]